VGAGELLGQAVDVVEVAVRLVLVLLVQLTSIEPVVVERAIRSAGSRAGRSVGGAAEGSLDWTKVSDVASFFFAEMEYPSPFPPLNMGRSTGRTFSLLVWIPALDAL